MHNSKFKIIAEESGKTQQEIANLLGVTGSYVSMAKNEKTTISKSTWLLVLKELKGMSRQQAEEQLARWQIEEAEKHIPAIEARQNIKPYHAGSQSSLGPAPASIDKMSESQLNDKLLEIAKTDHDILGGDDPRDLGERAKRAILKAYYR